MRRLALFALIPILGLSAPPPSQAQLLDLLTAPKTLFDRAIEARSTSDILEDNRIVAKVNGVMLDLGTIRASTEIYEQRLLITGLFNDKKLYDKFLADVKKIDGVKKLYWHVTHMTEKEQEAQKKRKSCWIGSTRFPWTSVSASTWWPRAASPTLISRSPRMPIPTFI